MAGAHAGPGLSMATMGQVSGESTEEQGVPLPESEQRRGQSGIIRAATASVVLSTCAQGTVRTLVLLGLGGSSVHVGLVTMLVQLTPVGQLFGLKILPRVGKGRLCIGGRLVALVPLAFLVGLALIARPSQTAIWLAMAAFAAVSLAHGTGDTGWWPLIQDNISGEALGAFLARMRIRLRLFEILMPLAVGVFLAAEPSTRRFALPLAAALLATALGAWFLKGLPERPAPPPTAGIFSHLLDAARLAPVRSYVIFTFAYWLIVSLAAPFWVVMLKSYGLPDSQVVWLGAIAAVGNMSLLKGWGNLVDRHGPRSAITLTLVGGAVLGFAWLLAPAHKGLLLLWAVPFFLVYGFLEGGLLMGRTKAMLAAIPNSHQAYGFTLALLTASAGAMVGAFAGGAAFDRLTRSGLTGGPFDVRLVYLAAAQLALLGVWAMSMRLSGYEAQTPTRSVMRALLRLRGRRAEVGP